MIPITVSSLKKKEKATPLQLQRCEANFGDKKDVNSIVVSTLVEGQYFGDAYLFNNETHYK